MFDAGKAQLNGTFLPRFSIRIISINSTNCIVPNNPTTDHYINKIRNLSSYIYFEASLIVCFIHMKYKSLTTWCKRKSASMAPKMRNKLLSQKKGIREGGGQGGTQSSENCVQRDRYNCGQCRSVPKFIFFLLIVALLLCDWLSIDCPSVVRHHGNNWKCT